jgi:hydrogenase small subunit
MRLTRREFIKAHAGAAAALGLTASGLLRLENVLAAEGAPPVVWLQAQDCTACTMSLLDTVRYATADSLLVDTIDLDYHTTVMAAAGDLAVGAAEDALSRGGYVLVVDGAIPTADGGRYCYLWEGMTALEGVKAFAANAAWILCVGTCASYGGVCAGSPNPTGAQSVSQVIGNTSKLINLPGCPPHPDWMVGTIAYLLAQGAAPQLDSNRRPTGYYGERIHEECPLHDRYYEEGIFAHYFSGTGCLRKLGCRGPDTRADCPQRRWNASDTGPGVNWCIGAGAPCYGCTEPTFPDGMSPFYTSTLGGGGDDEGGGEGGDHEGSGEAGGSGGTTSPQVARIEAQIADRQAKLDAKITSTTQRWQHRMAGKDPATVAKLQAKLDRWVAQQRQSFANWQARQRQKIAQLAQPVYSGGHDD